MNRSRCASEFLGFHLHGDLVDTFVLSLRLQLGPFVVSISFRIYELISYIGLIIVSIITLQDSDQVRNSLREHRWYQFTFF